MRGLLILRQLLLGVLGRLVIASDLGNSRLRCLSVLISKPSQLCEGDQGTPGDFTAPLPPEAGLVRSSTS